MLEPFSTPLVMRASLRDPGEQTGLAVDSGDPVWEFLFEHAADDFSRTPRALRPVDVTADSVLSRPVPAGLTQIPAEATPEVLADFWGKAMEFSSNVLTSPELTPHEFFSVIASAYRVWRDKLYQESADRN